MLEPDRLKRTTAMANVAPCEKRKRVGADAMVSTNRCRAVYIHHPKPRRRADLPVEPVERNIPHGATDRADPFVTEGHDHVLKPIGFWNGIVVDKCDDVASRVLHTDVPGLTDRCFRTINESSSLGEVGERVGSPIRRRPIDDDHLEIGICLPSQRFECVYYAITPVVGTDHDADGCDFTPQKLHD